MAVINEPKYDEDVVNLGYLKRILGLKDTDSVAIIVTKNYGTAPNPPYSLNDTYMYEGKVYMCIKAREIGEFNPDDWQLMADNSALGDYATNNKVDTAVGALNQKIETTATGINIEVAKKLDKNEFTHANIVLAINDNTSAVLINGDKISLAGKILNLTSDDITIDSTNFKVDKNGNVVMNNASVNGGKIKLIDKDKNNPMFIISDNNYENRQFSDIIYLMKDPNNFVNITATDYKYIWFVSENYGESYLGTNGNGAYQSLNSYKDGGQITLLSPFYNNPTIKIEKGDSFSSITQNGVWSPSFNNNSLESKKKNIDFDDGCLQEILNTDICSFNWKFEDDGDQKHIGCIIADEGGNYKIAPKVLTHDKDAIDLYSMAGMSWKAIQELYDIIKLQEQKIKELEERLNGIN